VLLGLEGERVAVDTRVRVAGVVPEGLKMVEVLAGLVLEAVLTVENNTERSKRTDSLATCSRRGGGGGVSVLDPGDAKLGSKRNVKSRRIAERDELGNTDVVECANNKRVGRRHGVESVGVRDTWVPTDSERPVDDVGRVEREERGVGGTGVGGEVPELLAGVVGLVGEAPDELLDRVVVGETDLGTGTGRGRGGKVERVRARVLNLLDEVLVTLLGEAATLLRVEVHVVTPHIERGGEARAVLRGKVEVETNLVVLEGDEGKVETRVPVEEEEEREDNLARGGAVGAGCGVGLTSRVGRELSVVGLLGVIHVELRVQAPPALVVLVNALTADGKLNVEDGALSEPAAIKDGRGRA